MNKFLNLLTVAQVATCKSGKIVYADSAAQGKMWIASGMPVVKVNSRTYNIEYNTCREMSKFLNQHGVAVKVISVNDKYSDNNGAYEVLTVVIWSAWVIWSAVNIVM